MERSDLSDREPARSVAILLLSSFAAHDPNADFAIFVELAHEGVGTSICVADAHETPEMAGQPGARCRVAMLRSMRFACRR